MKNFFYLFLSLSISLVYSQNKKIKILSSNFTKVDEQKFPNAIILKGSVKVYHDGATLDCNKALLYKDKNLFKAMGEVILEQGDSIIQYSDYATYNGNTKIAKSWGNVEINDKQMKLETDTLYFNRVKQILFYPNKGKITDKKNILKSIEGKYFSKEKKFIAKTKVTILNTENKLESNQLNYYTNNNLAYLYGPSTITNLKDSTKIYAERGFYDTNTDISYFVKNTKLFFKNRIIHADSMYYDKKKGFASASHNIKIIDTINNMVTKGNYAEIFEKKDSLFIIDKAVGITVKDNDSLYIHGDTIMLTGKPDKRIVRIFHNVKIFKSNLQGKCDSIYSSEITGLTKMYNSPILWSGNNQMTGDSIQILTNLTTKKLDSLFIYNNAFIIQKDTIHNKNFNQIKGRNMYGKFKKNNIKTLLVKGNVESLFYNYNEKTLKLETITKEIASDVEFNLKNNEIDEIKYFVKSEGLTYPPSKFPKKDKFFKGFIWREKEQLKTKKDIFLKEKNKNTKNQFKAIKNAENKFKLEVSKKNKK